MKLGHAPVLVGLVILAGMDAGALPILAIDVDPVTPGIQTSASISLSDSLAINIVVQDVDAEAPLHAFELALIFQASVIAGESVEIGPFLASPTILIEDSISPGSAAVAATTVGSAASDGTGVLATLSLRGLALGTSTLDLADVVLSQPFGVRLGAGELRGASLTVVPEPAGLILIGCCLAAVSAHRTRGRRAMETASRNGISP
jgi:hypothetical protein